MFLSAQSITPPRLPADAPRHTGRTVTSRVGVHVVLLVLLLCAPTAARADQPAAPVPILPDGLRWASPPGNPAVRGAWVVGGETAPGPYLFRVRIAGGGRIPPHVHPDTRNTTVLAGTLLVGFGTTVDEAKAVAVPAGAVYVAPANVPHWVLAKDGEAVYQESGVGPTATTPIPPSTP